MPDDTRTVPVTLDVEPNVAAALADVRTRAAMSRLLGRVLQPRAGLSELGRAIAEAKIEARAVGLTDADIDAELYAYNAERRNPPAP